MSIASEISRLQGVKADILQAISDKGVTVPAGSALADCAGYINQIEIGALMNGGALTDGATVNVPNNSSSTLTSSQSALTLNVNLTDATKVPNFAVEVTANADITLTVTKTVGNTVTTLNPSEAGGTSLTNGKLYQVTCVGSCWTLAEFTPST